MKCNSISVFSIECGKLLSDQIFPRQVFPGIINLLHLDKQLWTSVSKLLINIISARQILAVRLHIQY